MRPRSLDDVVGQSHLVGPTGPLRRLIESDRLSSIIVWGPPGTGKTTLAELVASTTQRGFERLSAVTAGVKDIREVIETARRRLTIDERGTVVFVDEIHRLPRSVEEVLYPAMEDYQIDLTIGEGPSARSIKLDLPRFTLVGATTRTGLLTSPLRDRFGIVQRLEFYQVDDLTQILLRSARLLEVPCDEAGAREIAVRSRGTPRIANRLLRRVRDFAEVRGDGVIRKDSADEALNLLKVDASGFDAMDRRLMMAMIEKFEGGPVGIDSMAAAIGEERDTIEDVYEPYLIQQGFIMRTPRGRVATNRAYLHFGLQPKSAPDSSVFQALAD